jgi:hypothetical protein
LCVAEERKQEKKRKKEKERKRREKEKEREKDERGREEKNNLRNEIECGGLLDIAIEGKFYLSKKL